MEDLAKQAREASVRSLPDDAVRRRSALDVAPENNPAWDKKAQFGHRQQPLGAEAALSHAVKNGGVSQSMLDNMVYEYRIAGLRPEEIAAKLGPPMTVERVNQILTVQVETINQITPTEMRALQIGRLEAVINMLWNMASTGSVEHIDVLIKAIERLNKLFELESEKTRIEVDVMTRQQVSVFSQALNMAVDAVTKVFQDQRQRDGLEIIDGEVIQQAVAGSLTSAIGIIEKAQQEPVVMERRGRGQAVLVSGTVS